MSWQSVFTSRLRALFGRDRLERELDDEVRFHLEMQVEDNVRAGMDPERARQAALRQFGGRDVMKETYRERRALPLVETIVQDVRYALRMMRKSPGFTSVAVVSLAIGIGANTAVFSFADTLLLRPLSVPRPGGLLTVGLTEPFRNSLVASYRDYVDIRDRASSFGGLTAFTTTNAAFTPEPGAAPTWSVGMPVTANFFRVVGLEPELGRDFRPEEDQVPGRDAVIILAHEFWQQQFGADPAILGRAIRLNGIDFTVIGVAPAGFTGLSQYTRYQFYVPLMMWGRLAPIAHPQPFEAREFRGLTVAGRLKDGVTLAAAQAELSVIGTDLERAHPETNRSRRIVARTELQTRIAQAPPVAVLALMLGMLAAAVLAVACANVAGLLTGRAPVRAREIALRMAIGAGRLRVVRQLVVESVLMAMAGGVAGLGVGYAGLLLFRQIRIPTDLPIVVLFELDRRVLLVSLLAALSSALLFGLAPAIRLTRADLTSAIRSTDAASGGRRRPWGRGALVIGQVGISVLLLVVATIIYRGFQQQVAAGPGFAVDHLLMLNAAPRLLGYSQVDAQRFFEHAAAQARSVPGVEVAALTRYMPLDGVGPAVTIVPEGFQFPPGQDSVTVQSSMVDEHYFDAIRLPILSGRAFRETDGADAPRVAVVNDVIAERYWPGQNPVGRRFRVDGIRGPWTEVVGVARTSKYGFIIERPNAFVYFPYRQRPADAMFLLVRSQGDPAALAAPLAAVVRALDANLPITNVRTMEELYRMRSLVLVEVIVSLIGAMGIMGLLLAIVGLYGLVAYSVSRRTREIGIRMAIGAGRPDILRMVLRQGAALATIGLGLGLLAGAGAARALGAIFPGGPGGDGRIDPVALPIVAGSVIAVTMIAAYVPARRASRINPTDALRFE